MEEYDFDKDVEFRKGLDSIREGLLVSGKSEAEIQDTLDKAKSFYYEKFIKPKPKPKSQEDHTGEPNHDPGHHKILTENTIVEAAEFTSNTSSSVDSEKITKPLEPKYPKSFAEVCDMIAKGIPIPGIKTIPDTTHDPTFKLQTTSSTMHPIKKPWESRN